MDVGWFDVCLRVQDFEASSAFYSALGFRMVEGDPAASWGVFVRENSRIGLFGPQFMGEDSFSLNFRGGCVPEIVMDLAQHGIQPISPAVILDGRSGSAKFRDPDGNLIFIDSAPGETKPE